IEKWKKIALFCLKKMKKSVLLKKKVRDTDGYFGGN
ncbi:hypothetical protein EfmE980_1292, partial [Enterococcus faecium E980]